MVLAGPKILGLLEEGPRRNEKNDVTKHPHYPPVKKNASSLILSFCDFPAFSGKKKAHKHKSFWPVTPPVTGGSPDREAVGQSFVYYPRSPRNINLFVRIPDREDR